MKIHSLSLCEILLYSRSTWGLIFGHHCIFHRLHKTKLTTKTEPKNKWKSFIFSLHRIKEAILRPMESVSGGYQSAKQKVNLYAKVKNHGSPPFTQRIYNYYALKYSSTYSYLRSSISMLALLGYLLATISV